MAQKDSDVLKKLLAIFRIEADEHLTAISARLLELEKVPTDARRMPLIEVIFRETHSLKGAARSVNMTAVETLCQSMESVLAGLKRRAVAFSPEIGDLFHRTVNRLEGCLAAVESPPTADAQSKSAVLTRQLDDVLKGAGGRKPRAAARDKTPSRVATADPATAGDPPPGSGAPFADTVRIQTAKLDSVLLQAEELLTAKLAAGQRIGELNEITAVFAGRRKEWTKNQPVLRAMQQLLEKNGQQNGSGHKTQQAMRLFEFLERDNEVIQSLEHKLTAAATAATQDQRSLAGMVDTLLEDTKKTLMLPFSSLLDLFPKLVRDLSHDQGKEAELVMLGREIDIDRRILEEMKDPLIHLVRNCMDHGIETPAVRMQRKKPPCGTVTIAIAPKDGNKVEILIEDDGAGIDVATVKSSAGKLGIVSHGEAEQLDEQEALALIFHSGVSTSPMITDLSGRGLGLAIVREKVEKLGGVVSVETRRDAGTTFRMTLPLTLATFRGILVRVGDALFVIPAANVERVASVGNVEIRTVENKEAVQLDGRVVALARLGDVLAIPGKKTADGAKGHAPMLVISLAGKRMALLADEILGEQEVLVKPLGRQLFRVRNIAGATVLGTGRVVPILNVHDVMKSAAKSVALPAAAASPSQETPGKKPSILVAEDSITARTLLKTILEAAGYRVKTVVDGVEAFTALKTEAFDVVVSDVDMPRMSGFELTAKIRADKKCSGLPVVLVTALESREDRERGIDAGANAYIVKSSFDQSNLLEVVRRLV
jgi:two-component system chemotaxis sensor kinase CheA